MDAQSIYERIDDNGIKLFFCDIPETKAATIEINKKYGIFINQNLIRNSDEEFIVAAHEYGHCMSGTTHKLNGKFDLISKYEYKADRKAILEFLPISDLRQAINYGCCEAYEFAEYLGMPEEFVVKAIEHYKAMELI